MLVPKVNQLRKGFTTWGEKIRGHMGVYLVHFLCETNWWEKEDDRKGRGRVYSTQGGSQEKRK